MAAALVQDGKVHRLVLLPGVKVFLKDAASGSLVPDAVAVTETSGYFRLSQLAPGRYVVCAQTSGFESDCLPAADVAAGTTATDPITLRPLPGAVWGRVRLRDGSPAVREGGGTHTTRGAATVSLVDASGKTLAGPASVNHLGQYVLAGVPQAGALHLRATYENGAVTRTIENAKRATASHGPTDVTLAVTPPKILSFAVTDGRSAITTAAPGVTVQLSVEARSAKGAALHYRWAATSAGLKSVDSKTVAWTLPPTPTVETAYVEVSDDRGGVTRGQIDLTVGAGPLALRAMPMARGPRPHMLAVPAHNGPYIDPLALMSCLDINGHQVRCASADAAEKETINYYKAIGVYDAAGNPTADRGSFKSWKELHGFSVVPNTPVADELRALYFNDGDLQFGRDMHCHSRDTVIPPPGGPLTMTTYACYVSNYGDASHENTPGADPQAAIQRANAGQNVIASVAMEVDVIPDIPFPPPAPRFIVFKKDGTPDTAAALDSEGRKAVPGLCMSCHGGRYTATSHAVTAANFLPFDTALLIQDATTGSPIGEPAQREAFRKLNQFVKNSAPWRATVRGLIDGMYQWCGGVSTAGCYIDAANRSHAYVPGGDCNKPDPTNLSCGWDVGKPPDSGNKPGFDVPAFYLSVPARYCRSCHVALSDRYNPQNFATWSNGQAKDEVFTGHFMPFAEVPYRAFWNNLQAQRDLTTFFRIGPSPRKVCLDQCARALGTCMHGAHTSGDRQECIRERMDCVKTCPPP